MARSRAWRRTVKVNAFSHRWIALVLGIFLVFEVATGVVLLFRPELYALEHPSFFAGTPSARPLSQQQAVAALLAQQPGARPEVVTTLDNVYQIEQNDYGYQYYIDAGTGHLLGQGSYDRGVLGWMLNLHDCMFSCTGYSGYLPFMKTEIPGLGITVAALILGLVGLAFLWLIVSGLVAWWPGVKRFFKGFRIYRTRGSYRYNRDLHDVLGVIAVPALLMWAVTGAGYELPFMADAWYAITGSAGDTSTTLTSTVTPGPTTAPDITPDQAIAAGHAMLPEGTLISVQLPASAEPTATYELFYQTGTSSDGYGGIRSFGDTTVAVDRHDPGHAAVTAGRVDTGQWLWAKWNFAGHFGYAVPWGWRLVWLAFGALPLILAYTGFRTWLVRRLLRRRRRHRGIPILEPEAEFLPASPRA